MNRCQSFLFFLFSIMLVGQCMAATITGTVTDSTGKPLAYSSIYIKGGSIGTTANAEGKFELDVSAGQYIIYCTHVGFQGQEKQVTIANTNMDITFRLQLLKVEVKDVIVKANAEDPALGIIRKTIAARNAHLNEIKSWQVDVYMKGIIRTVALPKSIFGVEFRPDNNIIDSSGKGIVYLAESLTKYSRRLPDDYREDIVSAKVSGRSQGFGFNSPNTMEFNLYENIIPITGLNARGFVSPIADNAFNFYNYKYQGTFYQNGVEINQIKVTPKKLYEPCFNGYINIIEDTWRIHSLNLTLAGTAQIEIVDSLNIQQQMLPLKEYWIPQQTTFYSSFGALGIKANANFTAVYSDYHLEPAFSKKFFGKIIRTADTSATKKSLDYWETIRPVPLTNEELGDYVKKDSLEKIYQDPAYLDSLDNRHNRVTPLRVIATGVNQIRRSKKMIYSYDPLINTISYNTVEGLVFNFSPRIQHYADTGSYTIVPTIHYGFANKRPQASLMVSKSIGQNFYKRFNLTLSGGRSMIQLNPANPITVFPNTIGTLFYEQNFLKLYEKAFVTASASKRLADGLRGSISLSYERRQMPANADTSYKWRDLKRRRFTNNYPEELPPGLFPKHTALLTDISIRYQPGQKYIQYPNRLFSVGSDWPVFYFYYTHGWKGLGSDVDFDKWRFTMTDEVNLRLTGTFHYRFSMAGFFNNRKVYLPDYHHFLGNRSVLAGPYLQTFQLADYYLNSNAEPFWVSANIEHHFNGALTNGIPFIQKFNLGLVGGMNTFFVNKNGNYAEAFVGVENILKIFRVDMIWGGKVGNGFQAGIRIGFSGVLTGTNVE